MAIGCPRCNLGADPDQQCLIVGVDGREAAGVGDQQHVAVTLELAAGVGDDAGVCGHDQGALAGRDVEAVAACSIRLRAEAAPDLPLHRPDQ